MIFVELRECDECGDKKNIKAFVGNRDICRLCWHYLTPQEKTEYIEVHRSNMSYYHNKRYWEKEKLARQKIGT